MPAAPSRNVPEPASIAAQDARSGLPAPIAELLETGEIEAWDPERILTWGIENFGAKLALSCSFGAPEGLVLLDMLHRIDPASRVFVLDTGRLPQATYDLIDRVRERYDKRIEVVVPDSHAVAQLVGEHGMNLFYESVEKRQLCCGVRKVKPLSGYLAGLSAWATGLRRDQNITRRDTPKLQVDYTHGGVLKLNPIADWKRHQVMEYVTRHQVPINALHAKGYPSVGCDPCSRAVAVGEDERAGRWWWENAESRECGIHTGEEGQGSGI